MPPIRYSMLNLAGALVWALLFTVAGHTGAPVLESTANHSGPPYSIALELLLGGLLVALLLRFQPRRARASSEQGVAPETPSGE